jgi:hypothetical protein
MNEHNLSTEVNAVEVMPAISVPRTYRFRIQGIPGDAEGVASTRDAFAMAHTCGEAWRQIVELMTRDHTYFKVVTDISLTATR